MNWLFFALLAPALDTVILYLDRYVIEHEIPDYRGLVIFSSIIGSVAGTLYWIATGFPLLDTHDMLIVLATGILSIWGLALYYKALSQEETSNIIIFFKTIPIFVLFLSFLFLKETISTKQLVGFFVILISVVGASLKTNTKKMFFSSALGLILLVDIMWASSAILIKFALNLNSFATILSYEGWGVAIGGLILYIFSPTIRASFRTTATSIRKFALLILIVNESLYLLSRAITFYAYSLGPVALVSVIGGTQVFYGIASGFILTKTMPKLFHENINKKKIQWKLMFASLLIIGIYLVA
jgi:bacterial/archaeal transporter family protein